MSEWINLSPDNSQILQLYEGSKSDDVVIEVTVSPYDVPDAVKGYYEESTSKFIVEFKYLSTEQETLEVIDDDTSVRTGINSGRIYGFEVDLNKIEVGSVNLQIAVSREINGAIESLMKDNGRSKRLGNFELVREAVSSTDQIYEPLASLSAIG